MHNSIILTFTLLLIGFTSSAYAHTGPHNDSWLQSTIHFATSPDHLPFIVSTLIILTIAIGSIAIVRRRRLKTSFNHR